MSVESTQSKQIQAFNQYFELTKTGVKIDDAMKQIAEEFNVSRRTLYRWKKDYFWDKHATEKSIELNKKMAEELDEQSKKAVRDFRKPFINILNKLIARCVHEQELRIVKVSDLVLVMETVIKLQKELDIGTKEIVSSDYDREKHVKEINGLLRALKNPSSDDENDDKPEKDDLTKNRGVDKNTVIVDTVPEK